MKTPASPPEPAPPEHSRNEPAPPTPAPPTPAPPELDPEPEPERALPGPVSPGIVASVRQVRTPRELELENRISTLEDENQRLRAVQGAPPRPRRWSDDLL